MRGGVGKRWRGAAAAGLAFVFATAAAGEPPPLDADALAEEAAERAAVLVLKDRARARGEYVDIADFIVPATPEADAAAAALDAWLKPLTEEEKRRRADKATLENVTWLAAYELLISDPGDIKTFRTRLAAFAESPRATLAAHEAAMRAALDAAAPLASPLLKDWYWGNVDGILPHLQAMRALARSAGCTARTVAVEEGAAAGFAALRHAARVERLVPDRPFLINMLMALALRGIWVNEANRVLLLDPPPPDELRAFADFLDAQPSLEPGFITAYQLERCMVERLYYRDNALLEPTGHPVEVDALLMESLERSTLPFDPAREPPYREGFREALAAAPFARPNRNLHRLYREMELAFADPDAWSKKEHVYDSLPARFQRDLAAWKIEIRLAADAADRLDRPYDFSRVGAASPLHAFWPIVALGQWPKIRPMLMREAALRQVMAYAFRRFADGPGAHDGKPLPNNPLTREPFEPHIEDGCLVFAITERFDTVRLPLRPGDAGYDPAAAWAYGRAPLFEPEPAPWALTPATPEVF